MTPLHGIRGVKITVRPSIYGCSTWLGFRPLTTKPGNAANRDELTAMDELMCAADLVLSKPGGLTTSEILARGAAFAIVNPIPGQESRNSDYLLENGAAIKINNIPTMPHKLARLLADPKRLQSLKDRATWLARQRAAYEVADIAVGLAG